MQALPLDEVPAVKVYLGLPLFGARAPTAGEQSLGQRQAQDYALRIFEPVVVGAEQELHGVLRALRDLSCLRANERIGLLGFSAGGTAVLLALMDPSLPVGVAITINAPTSLNAAVDAVEHATQHPYVWSAPSRRLAQHSDAIAHATEIAAGHPPPAPAVFLFHGAQDTVIAPQGTAALGAALHPLYEESGNAQRLKIVVEPGVSHAWAADPHGLEQVRTAVADWLKRYL